MYISIFSMFKKGEKMSDSFNLNRFHEKSGAFEVAKRELLQGRKWSHWMWYMFPQIDGLAYSDMSKYYSIKNLEEAKAFLDDQELGGHLIELCKILLQMLESDPLYVFGDPDFLKLKSSMTLFSIAAPENDIFARVLQKFYKGETDAKTISILKDLGYEIGTETNKTFTKEAVLDVLSETYLSCPDNCDIAEFVMLLKDKIKAM